MKKVLEGTEIPYEDGIYVHYVNAEIDDNSEIAKLMEYFKTTDPADGSQGDLSKRVQLLKGMEGREEPMCEAADKLMELGEKIGEARVNALMQKLIRANRMEDLTRSTQDAEFQRKLFEEFDL